MIEFRFAGGAELEAALRALGPRVARRVLNNAARAGGRVIARHARAAAPRDTGELARSVRVRAVPRRPGVAVVGVVRPRGRIAHLLEFGTRNMAARPFLRPALDRGGQEAVRAIGEALARGIEREVAKLRGGA